MMCTFKKGCLNNTLVQFLKILLVQDYSPILKIFPIFNFRLKKFFQKLLFIYYMYIIYIIFFEKKFVISLYVTQKSSMRNIDFLS